MSSKARRATLGIRWSLVSKIHLESRLIAVERISIDGVHNGGDEAGISAYCKYAAQSFARGRYKKDVSKLVVGEPVRLSGLNDTRLNDKAGIISAPLEATSGRVGVHLRGKHDAIAVKPENLVEYCPRPEDRCLRHGTFFDLTSLPACSRCHEDDTNAAADKQLNIET